MSLAARLNDDPSVASTKRKRRSKAAQRRYIWERQQQARRVQAARATLTEKIVQRNVYRLADRARDDDVRDKYRTLGRRISASRGHDDGAAPFMVEMLVRLERGDQSAADWLGWRLQTTQDTDLRFMLEAIFELAGKRIARREEIKRLPVLSVRWATAADLPARRRRRKRGTALNLIRRPRARGAGRPKAAPTRRPTSGGRDGPPDDDGSGSSEPPPSGRRAVYTYGVRARESWGLE